MSEAQGYSGTPLTRKLGYKAGMRVCWINAPVHYSALLDDLPGDLVHCRPGDGGGGLDFIHAFVSSRAELAALLDEIAPVMQPAATLWISWPKKSAAKKLGIASDISEETIRELALPLGLVDVKVCAVDETWSGLKLVWRLEHR